MRRHGGLAQMDALDVIVHQYKAYKSVSDFKTTAYNLVGGAIDSSWRAQRDAKVAAAGWTAARQLQREVALSQMNTVHEKLGLPPWRDSGLEPPVNRVSKWLKARKASKQVTGGGGAGGSSKTLPPQIAAQVSLTKTMLGYHKDKRKLELELASLSGGLQQLSLATAAIEALGPQGNVQVLESQLNHMKGEAESKLLQSAKAASGGASAVRVPPLRTSSRQRWHSRRRLTRRRPQPRRSRPLSPR